MKFLLLAAAMLPFILFTHFMVARFGDLLDENRSGYQNQQDVRQAHVIRLERGSIRQTVKHIDTILQNLPEIRDYDIVICRHNETDIVEHLQNAGFKIEYEEIRS